MQIPESISSSFSNGLGLEAAFLDNGERRRQRSQTPLRVLFLINAKSTDLQAVKAELEKIEGISEVYQVKGAYNLIALTEAEPFGKLKTCILRKIRNVSSIKSKLTLTLI